MSYTPGTESSASAVQLPELIQRARAFLQDESLRDRVTARIVGAAPSLADYLSTLPPKVFGVDSGFFYLATAQALAWGFPEDSWLQSLGAAAVLGSVHFAAQDQLIDSQRPATELFLLSDVAHTLYLRDLRVLDASEPCESHHDRYFELYLAAIIQEQHHRATIIPYSAAELLQLADKAAPLNMGFPLLISRGQRDWASLPKIELALRLLCLGLQLHDDIMDIADDLCNGYISFPATITLMKRMGQAPGPLDEGIDHAEVEGQMYFAGVASALYRFARHCFSQSRTIASGAGAEALADLAQYWSLRTNLRLQRIQDANDAIDCA